jgi:hypothetical protein
VDAGDEVKVDGEWRMPPKVDIVDDKQPAALMQSQSPPARAPDTGPRHSVAAAAFFRAFDVNKFLLLV